MHCKYTNETLNYLCPSTPGTFTQKEGQNVCRTAPATPGLLTSQVIATKPNFYKKLASH